MSRNDSRGTPASETDRAALRACVVALGEGKAAKALGVDPMTVARALAELPLQRRTLDHLRRVLAEPLSANPAQLSLPLTSARTHVAA